jgi:hypothetical protein
MCKNMSYVLKRPISDRRFSKINEKINEIEFNDEFKNMSYVLKRPISDRKFSKINEKINEIEFNDEFKNIIMRDEISKEDIIKLMYSSPILKQIKKRKFGSAFECLMVRDELSKKDINLINKELIECKEAEIGYIFCNVIGGICLSYIHNEFGEIYLSHNFESVLLTLGFGCMILRNYNNIEKISDMRAFMYNHYEIEKKSDVKSYMRS